MGCGAACMPSALAVLSSYDRILRADPVESIIDLGADEQNRLSRNSILSEPLVYDAKSMLI